MTRINFDALGIGISIACAIHCAILPLMVTVLPVFGAKFMDHTGFEYLMIGLAAVVGMISLWHGYRKHHRQPWPSLIFMAGILLLMSKQIFITGELALLIPAVILIITAHWYNYRLCRKPKP
ncbi:MerC domain-containing protein [Pollutibacter soli]|uniref:MerC domain-containing protein n=1 Tax=Pollutibacter soli TaxID=3034157 RepID=UPI003013ABDA